MRGRSSLRWGLADPWIVSSARKAAGTATEFAIGAGRAEGSAELDAYLRPDDVAHAVRVVLEQPRSVRTTVWQLWSANQQS